jgi:hypothetical protein
MSENGGARSYKSEVIGDSMAITINFKWLLQILALVGTLVYSYWQIMERIRILENNTQEAMIEIEQLFSKHQVQEDKEFAEMEEKLSLWEKELDINPLSILKKMKGDKRLRKK